jgi:hypothetical protein
MLSSKNNNRNRLIGIATVVSLSIGVMVPQAKAFDLLQFASNVFGVGDLYTSATGLFSSVSNLYQNIQGLTSDIVGAIASQGDLGILDPNKLYDEALDTYSATSFDPAHPENLDLKAQRIKASVASKTGSAPLTKEGQQKAIEAAQQQTNLAAAADQSMQDTQNATSSLEALQNGIGATNAISQQLKGISTQMLQSNQTQAASVQIQEQIGREAAAANATKEIEKDEQLSTITKAGAVPFPMFHEHE